MNEDNLDRILKSEEDLVPSSGFVAAVMERVREEAAAPAPIPFPWKRLVPGIVLAAGLLSWCGVELMRLGLQDLRAVAPTQLHLSTAFAGTVGQTGWVTLALGVSMATWLLSRRIVGRSGLL
jgi:hypothetical protein